jgi:predicted nucleotidyltransferase component of viral defense system
MIFTSARLMKDRLKNEARRLGIPPMTVMNHYMMERLLARLAASSYHDRIIIKGGFLIASMIGVDLRTTQDLDATIKGLPVDERLVRDMMDEVMGIDLGDWIVFQLSAISSIREDAAYETFRVSLEAQFQTIHEQLSIDITTGDAVIPREIDYAYKLMFEDMPITVRAYNLQTILAEKIETILIRNVANTRSRDYYDVYVLMKMRASELDRDGLRDALRIKTRERGTEYVLTEHAKLLRQIFANQDLHSLWTAYQKQYPYAAGIQFDEIVAVISNLVDQLFPPD